MSLTGCQDYLKLLLPVSQMFRKMQVGPGPGYGQPYQPNVYVNSQNQPQYAPQGPQYAQQQQSQYGQQQQQQYPPPQYGQQYGQHYAQAGQEYAQQYAPAPSAPPQPSSPPPAPQHQYQPGQIGQPPPEIEYKPPPGQPTGQLEGPPLPTTFVQYGLPPPKEGVDSGTACDEFCSCPTWTRIFIHMAIVAGIIVLTIGFALGGRETGTMIMVGGVLLGVGYLSLLIDTFCLNENFKFLNNIEQSRDIQSLINAVRLSPPSVSWHITCYHYETRHRHRHETDAHGHTREWTEEYQERVTTWWADKELMFDDWWDSSLSGIAGLGDYKRTRLDFFKTFNFADPASETAFLNQKMQFIEANRWRDRYYSIYEHYHVAGFQSRVLAAMDSNEKPMILNVCWYILAVFLLMELPFSYMLKKEAPKRQFVFVKTIQCAPFVMMPMSVMQPMMSMMSPLMTALRPAPSMRALPVVGSQQQAIMPVNV